MMRLITLPVSLVLATLLLLASAAAAPIHDAAASGDVARVKRLLKENPKLINRPDSYQHTPLFVAASEGRVRVVKLLLQRKADTEIPDTDDFTALLTASEGGHLEVVKLLLAHGAKVNHRSAVGGDNALTRAALNGNPKLIRVLLAKGADPFITSWVPAGCGPIKKTGPGPSEVTPYQIAVACKHTEAAEILRKHMEAHKSRAKKLKK